MRRRWHFYCTSSGGTKVAECIVNALFKFIFLLRLLSTQEGNLRRLMHPPSRPIKKSRRLLPLLLFHCTERRWPWNYAPHSVDRVFLSHASARRTQPLSVNKSVESPLVSNQPQVRWGKNPISNFTDVIVSVRINHLFSCLKCGISLSAYPPFCLKSVSPWSPNQSIRLLSCEKPHARHGFVFFDRVTNVPNNLFFSLILVSI